MSVLFKHLVPISIPAMPGIPWPPVSIPSDVIAEQSMQFLLWLFFYFPPMQPIVFGS